MGFSWYPGHMAKAVTQLRQSMKLIDVIIEILDARAPRATQNTRLSEIVGGKPRVVVLCKADLADPASTRVWAEHYLAAGIRAIPADCKTGEGVPEAIAAAIDAAGAGEGTRAEGRHSSARFRTAVLGIPNVGKSSFINRAAKRSRARVGDRPGVTRAKQWIVIDRDLEMLDTPGIMPPRVGDRRIWMAIAALGCLDDSTYDVEMLASALLTQLDSMGIRAYRGRYRVPEECSDPHEALEHVARSRGCMRTGGKFDTARAAEILVRDFRLGKLGRATLELP
jgi:ribosome biogenesis GTPase A